MHEVLNTADDSLGFGPRMAFDAEAWRRDNDMLYSHYFGGPKATLRNIVQSLKMLMFWSWGGRPAYTEIGRGPLNSIRGADAWQIYGWT